MSAAIRFESTTEDFGAHNAAEKWLRERGYSCGSMERDQPIGVHKGENVYISKWTRMTTNEQGALDGRMTSPDFKRGPVTILFSRNEPSTDDNHECDSDWVPPEWDICSRCKDHAGFCSVCHESNCCGRPPVRLE